MKKKSGFTLIELLAVIVILAIIALIAVPQIMKILYQARLKAAEDATYGMIKSTESFLASQIITNDLEKNNFEFKCYKNGVCKDSVEKDEDDETEYPEYILDYKGKKIIGGEINVLNRNLIQVDEIIAFGFKCSKDYDEEIVHCTPLDGTETYYEEGQTEEVVVDNNPGVICGDTSVEQYDSISECHIKSMEDWNEFRKLVNEDNKNFQNKKVILDVNLSFNNLTFEEIGTSTNFKGNFYGRNKKLSDITINSTTNSSGIFKVNEGKIEYLKIDNITLVGNNNVGALVGTNNGTVIGITASNINVSGTTSVGGLVGNNTNYVSDVIIDSKVTGSNYLGGVTGYNNWGKSTINVIVKNTEITKTTSGGVVGGIAGSDQLTNIHGIVENGSITNDSPSNCKCIGYDYNATGYCSNTFKINGTNQSGITVGNNMLPVYNTYIDTYMDGEDGNGYYFDYDKHGNIVIKSTTDDPIDFNLTGDGTESNPYLISNSKEWKQAVLRANETDAHFKITKDIDFKNIPTYPFKSLAGKINGDGHTISNVKMYGTIGSMGMIITNNGKIENLKLNNITLEGDGNNVGTLAGSNNGEIVGIIANNINIAGSTKVGGLVGNNTNYVSDVIIDSKVTGSNYLGGVTGYNNWGKSTINVIVKNTEITKTTSGGVVGGIAGSDQLTNIHGIVENGSITNDSPSNCKCIGYDYNATGYCSNTFKINGTNQSGITIGENILPVYDAYIDTYIGGDNDSNGYYFDYDNEGKITIKNTAESPIEFNLQGDGSENNPYLITNSNDWKQATLRANETNANFKITKDIDFDNKGFYPFQSLSGKLYGDNHTISNVKMYGTIGSMGMIITNNGRIEYLKLKNVTLEGDGNNVGVLAGTNNGEIAGITANNINIAGSTKVGGLVGNNTNYVSDIIIDSKVTGSNYLGGVTGYNNWGKSTINVIVKNTEITKTTSGGVVGGIAGSDQLTNIHGIVENGSITNDSPANCKCIGYDYNATGYCSNTFKINGTNQSGITIGNNMLQMYDAYIDTYIGGDNDSNGYYFEYDNNQNIIIKSTKESPIEFNLQGQGTESNPYLISNENEWNKASMHSSENDAYFKITNDLDFSNKQFYPIPTLNGNLDGDGHEISNVHLYESTGSIGIVITNNGRIENLKLNNITIEGDGNNVGALVGSNTGTILAITAHNINVTGATKVGGLVGDNNNLVSNVIIDSKVTGSNYLGGVTGLNYWGKSTINVIVNNTEITKTTPGGIVAGIAGAESLTNIHGIVEDGYIVNESPNRCYCIGFDYNATGHCLNQFKINGNPVTNTTINGDKLTFYNSYIDTDIDSIDTDSDGYYFGYDSSNNIVIKKA